MSTDDWRSWLDALDTPQDEPHEEAQDGLETGHDDAQHDEQSGVAASRARGVSIPRWWRLVAAAAVLMGVGAGIASIVIITLHGDDMQAASATVTTETVVPSPSVTTTSVAQERCPKQVPARDTTMEGVVVAFQQAYFAADYDKLIGFTTDDSYLRDVDWTTAVGELKGADFCAVTKKESDSTVAATVTVRTPGKEELVYRQVYTVTKDKNTWKIAAIEDKDEK